MKAGRLQLDGDEVEHLFVVVRDQDGRFGEVKPPVLDTCRDREREWTGCSCEDHVLPFFSGSAAIIGGPFVAMFRAVRPSSSAISGQVSVLIAAQTEP